MKSSNRMKLSFAVVAGLSVSAARATTYSITDLGIPYSAAAVALNNSGQIVGDTGYAGNGVKTYTGQAFLWQPTTPNATTGSISYPIAPSTNSAVTGINSMGQISGYTEPFGSSNYSSCLFSPATANAISGSTTILPIIPPGDNNFSFQGGINDLGQVASEHYYPTTAASFFTPTTPNGNTGTVTDLIRAFYVPSAISNSGQVVGALADYGGTYQAGRFEPSSQNGTVGQYVDIADPGQGGTAFQGPGGAISVNSIGDTASDGSTMLNQQQHALIWKQTGQVIDLDPMLGGTGAEAVGINNADQVVGETAGSHAFIYANGAVTDLNTLITAPNWVLNYATAINDKGQIIGEGNHNGSAAAYLLTPILTVPIPSQWNTPNSGDWNNSANWTAGIPDSAGAEADFFNAIGSNQTIYTNLPVTVGTINFNNSNSYVVTGASTITLLAATGNALILAQQGTQEINLPLYVASNATFNAASGATLIIANPVIIISGIHATTIGNVLFQSQITLQSSATLTINGSNYASAITVSQLAVATLANHGSSAVSVLQLDNLTVNGGDLDLTNNALIVRNGNIATETALVQSGFNKGSWTGAGVTSSTAAADTKHLTAVGVIANTVNGVQLYGGGTLFDGTSPGSGDILFKYTYYGDTNLNGAVDGSDYSRIDNGFLSHGGLTGWFNGDFNYDGAINGSDYTLIDNAFNIQGIGLTDEIAQATAQLAGNTSAVPEPTVMALVIVAAASQLRRRARHR